MGIACYIRSDTVFQQVREALGRAGFECVRFDCETSLLRALRRSEFDLILIELDSEPANEERLSTWLNCRDGESTPVMLVSASASDGQIVRALDAGADAFIEAPFHAEEFVARVHAVLRCYTHSVTQCTVELNGFELDRKTYQILDRGVQVELTPREFAMAWMFFCSPGVYLSRDTISAAVWGVDSEIASRTIEQHVYKLRKKLNLCGARGVRIRTAYTRGYRLELCDPVADGDSTGLHGDGEPDRAS